jgi:hypothetical protein
VECVVVCGYGDGLVFGYVQLLNLSLASDLYGLYLARGVSVTTVTWGGLQT